jgi:hypothetical protein
VAQVAPGPFGGVGQQGRTRLISVAGSVAHGITSLYRHDGSASPPGDVRVGNGFTWLVYCRS